MCVCVCVCVNVTHPQEKLVPGDGQSVKVSDMCPRGSDLAIRSLYSPSGYWVMGSGIKKLGILCSGRV